MKRAALALAFLLFALPGFACVGKSLLIGTDSSPESKAVAQVLAVLIYERTGTTVEIVDHSDNPALFKGMTEGDVDLALDYSARALKRAGIAQGSDALATLDAAKELYLEKFNLVWLSPFGFAEPSAPLSKAATVAQKHTLKKFPALPRLLAKASDHLKEDSLKALVEAPNTAKAAREFLKKNKLI